MTDKKQTDVLYTDGDQRVILISLNDRPYCISTQGRQSNMSGDEYWIDGAVIYVSDKGSASAARKLLKNCILFLLEETKRLKAQLRTNREEDNDI